MDAFFNSLQQHFPFIVEHKYVFFFLGGAIEGLNTMILAGFLYSVGKIAFWPVVIALVLGYCVHGQSRYWFGRLGGASSIEGWIKKNPKRHERFEMLRSYFERYSGWVIVLTKATISMTDPTIILAGFLRYNFKRFVLFDFIGSVGWVAVTFSIGYFFGQGYESVAYLKNITYALMFLAGAVLSAFLVKKVFNDIGSAILSITAKFQVWKDKINRHINNIPPDQEN
ncbi:MAG: DedA family protein [Patescibacteria group bacterium]